MTLIRIKTLFVLASVGLFSQFAAAESEVDSAAMKQIAAVIVTLDHFPTDEDFVTLDEIMSNGEVSAEVQLMAETVANIEHSANEEGKEAMTIIAGDSNASEQAKGLAGIIANVNHAASDSAKEQIAILFP